MSDAVEQSSQKAVSVTRRGPSALDENTAQVAITFARAV
jgi:hypothetical protein